MSLIENILEPFILLNKTKTSDGEGGFITTWSEGATFNAVATCDTTMSARIAESEGVTSTYTVTTNKSQSLEFHDVIKRVSDGKIFRITSDGGDKVSPACSSLNISQVTAEKWTLTE